MLNQVDFLEDMFIREDDGNVLCELTNNTIILCSDAKVKHILSERIIKCFNSDTYEKCNYDHDEGDELNIELAYRPTTILNVINNRLYRKQRIVISIEAPFMLQADNPYDIWFARKDKDADKILLYAFTTFKGYNKSWNKGVLNVYKETINGHFGDFGVVY